MDEKNFKIEEGTNKIYPTAPLNNSGVFPSLLVNELNQERLDEMNEKYREMHKTLRHYTKLEKRWTKANNILKLSALTLGVGTSVLACLASSGLVLPLEVIAVSATSVLTSSMIVGTSLGAVGALELIISKIITSTFTSKRKKYYHNKVLIVKKYIDHAYIFIEKARNDRMITLKELEDFRAILHNLTNELERANKGDEKEVLKLIQDIKVNNNINNNFPIKNDFSKIR